jgi:hypothetical protein
MPPTFAGVSADGTRVAFTTAEALLPADVDAAVSAGAQSRSWAKAMSVRAPKRSATPMPGRATNFGVAAAVRER